MNEYGFSQGLARNASQSAYPGLWRGLVQLIVPSAGLQGARVLDFSPSGLNGYFSTAPLWTTGRKGPCLNFNSTSSRVDFPQRNLLSDAIGATWMFWLKTSASTGRITTQWSGSVGTRQYDVELLTGSKIQLAIASAPTARVDNGPALPSGAWTHVAITFLAPTTVLFYYNGVLQTTTTTLNNSITSLSPNAIVAQTIGFESSTSTAGFTGYLDHLSIYKRRLSAVEIIQSYMGASPLVPISEYILAKTPSAATGFGPLLSFQRNYRITS